MRINKFEKLSQRTTLALIAGAIVLVAIVAAAVGIPTFVRQKSAQSVLPFADLKGPTGVAVDNDADVYVVDELGRQLEHLAADSRTPLVMPLQGGGSGDPNVGRVAPAGVAVDNVGDIYLVGRMSLASDECIDSRRTHI